MMHANSYSLTLRVCLCDLINHYCSWDLLSSCVTSLDCPPKVPITCLQEHMLPPSRPQLPYSSIALNALFPSPTQGSTFARHLQPRKMASCSLMIPQLFGQPTFLVGLEAALPAPSFLQHFIFPQARLHRHYLRRQYFIFRLVVDIDFDYFVAEVVNLHLRSGLKWICSIPHRILQAFGGSDRFVGWLAPGSLDQSIRSKSCSKPSW